MQFIEYRKSIFFQNFVLENFISEFHELNCNKSYGKHGDILKKQFVKYLKSKGFKAKYNKNKNDIIICMKDKDYTFFYLKYI